VPAFPPIAGDNSEILVLGSMPGRKSLDKQEYYAHPQNSFWWIMAKTFDQAKPDCYAQRKALARDNRVAIWDVLHDCERAGSLDSRIVRDSERVNDLKNFLSRYPSIMRVLFNGVAAQNIFQRHCGSLKDEYSHVEWLRMPSTSPAHASMRPDQKLKIWLPALSTREKF